MGGSVLAYIGDAILSLSVREYLVGRGYTKAKDLQEKSIIYVSANGQAKLMNQILADEMLSEDEMVIYKRGRNHNVGSVAKNADINTYRIATGFEALFGYWYYTDKDRLEEMTKIMLEYYQDMI